MCTILLHTILDSGVNLPDAGVLLYETIQKKADRGEKVVIDMTDVTSLSSVFLNTSIGKVIDQYGIDFLKKNISFVKITKQQAERLKDYLIKYKAH